MLRSFELHHAQVNIRMSLPSLDAIKRAVEEGLGLALLPRRCALAEITRGQLVAVTMAFVFVTTTASYSARVPSADARTRT